MQPLSPGGMTCGRFKAQESHSLSYFYRGSLWHVARLVSKEEAEAEARDQLEGCCGNSWGEETRAGPESIPGASKFWVQKP